MTDTVSPQADLTARWKPSDEQITAAKAMLAAHPTATCVIVPLALPGKIWGIWNTGQPVEPAPGFWLADGKARTGPLSYNTARHAAEDSALAHLASDNEWAVIPGTACWAVIQSNGDFAVFEGRSR